MDAQATTNSPPVAQGGASGATVFRLQNLSAKLAQLIASGQPLAAADLAQAFSDLNLSAMEIMTTLMGPTPMQQYQNMLGQQILAANAQADRDAQTLMTEADAKLDSARATIPLFRPMAAETPAPAPTPAAATTTAAIATPPSKATP